MTPTFRRISIDSPVGEMLGIINNNNALCALNWRDHSERVEFAMRRAFKADVSDSPTQQPPQHLEQLLMAYFKGDLDAINSIEIDYGGSDFQRQVWQGLRTLNSGETMAYGEFAARLGQHRKARAIGHANGANPVCIVVPCHRLVAAGGSLTAYGGGIERKAWLLRHEGIAVDENSWRLKLRS